MKRGGCLDGLSTCGSCFFVIVVGIVLVGCLVAAIFASGGGLPGT